MRINFFSSDEDENPIKEFESKELKFIPRIGEGIWFYGKLYKIIEIEYDYDDKRIDIELEL